MLTQQHKDFMIGSYRNISFDPERRGEQDFNHYNALLADDLKIVGESNERYKEKFISKLMLIYSHKSNTASAMIVGPARFKVNHKRLNWERGAYDKFTHWRNRYLKLVQRQPRATIQESIERLQNRGSQYARGKVKQLEARQTLADNFESFKLPCGGLVTLENERLVVTHKSKPSLEVLALIKKRGFKYSPRTKTWVRQFTGNALHSLKLLREELEQLNREALKQEGGK